MKLNSETERKLLDQLTYLLAPVRKSTMVVKTIKSTNTFNDVFHYGMVGDQDDIYSERNGEEYLKLMTKLMWDFLTRTPITHLDGGGERIECYSCEKYCLILKSQIGVAYDYRHVDNDEEEFYRCRGAFFATTDTSSRESELSRVLTKREKSFLKRRIAVLWKHSSSVFIKTSTDDRDDLNLSDVIHDEDDSNYEPREKAKLLLFCLTAPYKRTKRKDNFWWDEDTEIIFEGYKS